MAGAHCCRSSRPIAHGRSLDIDVQPGDGSRVGRRSGSGVTVLNLKDQVDALYTTYLAGAVRLSLAGFAAIVVLLLVALRRPARVVRVVLPLALAVLTVAASPQAVRCSADAAARRRHAAHRRGRLELRSFLRQGRPRPRRHRQRGSRGAGDLTLASLLVANCSTVLAFGVLALSSVPVLHDLGETVAPGAFLALVYAALLAREPAR